MFHSDKKIIALERVWPWSESRRWRKRKQMSLAVSSSFSPLCLNHLPRLRRARFSDCPLAVFVCQGRRLEAGLPRLDGANAADGAGQSGLRETGGQNLW